MKTLEKLTELESQVNEAKTYNAEGRQIVANSCKELYNLVEEGFYNQYGEEAINDAYADLCNGNFAEPFMCEQKKSRFLLYKKIYTENILPKLKAA